MPRTCAMLDRASLEEATLDRLQAEARRYRLPVGGERSDLIDRIMSHIERMEAQEMIAETQSGPSSGPSVGEEATGELEEPLTMGTLRSALNEMTDLMRQQQQSIQMMLQLMANQSGASPVVVPVGVQSLNAEMESGALSAPTPNHEIRPAKNMDTHIPGNSVSWLDTQIPEYGGSDKENVSTWVRRVDQVAAVHGASDGVTLLASSKLTKSAKTWYEVQTGAAVESWIGLRRC